jgi:hypothetical protein
MAEQKQPVKLTVSGILTDLDNGLTRTEIGEKYGLDKTQVGKLFDHPKLKGRKTKAKKEVGFELVDDAPEAPLTKYGPKKKKAEGAETTTSEASSTEEQASSTTAEETPQNQGNQQAAPVTSSKGAW